MITIERVLTPDELIRVHAIIDRATWEPGRDSASRQASSIKHNEQLAHQSPEMREIRQIVLEALDRHPVFFSATLPRRVFPPRVNRYRGDTNAFGAHVDNAIRYLPELRERMRTDLSCTLFLAAPESYDGGELVVHATGGARAVKLAAGDAIVYPGSTVHEVLPVSRGARLACFFWIESMVRDNTARDILVELDRTIQMMRNASGDVRDSAHTVALTGTYHNLLRHWADV